MPMLNAFPNIVKILKLLGADNDMPLRNPDFILVSNEWSLTQLEQDIEALTDEELYVFVCGELDKVNSMIQAKHLKYLDDFLNSAFDGELQQIFYSL